MEYITPNFTKDMVKTHKILIPNMAVTQFRLMQAALASEGYQTEVLGNCGSEVAQLGLKYVHNDTCYPALLVIGQFLDALNSGKYDLDHTALLITQTGGGCRASNYIKLLRKALVKAGYGNIPVASLNFSGLEKGSGLPLTLPLLRKVIASIFYGDMLVALRSQTHPYENHKGDADAMTEKWIATIQGWIKDDKNYSAHDNAGSTTLPPTTPRSPSPVCRRSRSAWWAKFMSNIRRWAITIWKNSLKVRTARSTCPA